MIMIAMPLPMLTKGHIVDELVAEILGHIKDGKSANEIANLYTHEGADVVGEAFVEADSLRALELLKIDPKVI